MFFNVFKRNPFHDAKGRFTTKDKAGGSGVSLAGYYEKYDDPKVTAKTILSKFSKAERGEIALAVIKAESSPSSKELYTDKDGNYTAARKQLHHDIINEFLNESNIARATPKAGEKPSFVVLGGRGGSGKSAFTNGRITEFDAERHIVLDTDAIKARLKPPYAGWNAHSVHEESADIFDVVTKLAKAKGLNLVHDATLKSLGVEKTIQEMKAAGYDVQGHYMFVPRQVSAERAVKRYLSKGPKQRGRLVPVDVILKNTDNEKNFDHLKKYFSKWSAYDNQGESPKLIGKGAA